MKFYFLYFILLFFASFQASLNAFSITFVHIGPSFPHHLEFSIAQARLFNKECSIYLIANEQAIMKGSSILNSYSVIPISCESLILSERHLKFQNSVSHEIIGTDYTKLYWVYTTERFFYLDDFVRMYNLSDVFHLENDVMLYVDLSELLPVFRKHYNGMIGATFETDSRCVAGFLYIANSVPLGHLINSFPDYVNSEMNDMLTIAQFKNNYLKVFIDYLPVLTSEYIEDHKLELSQKSNEFLFYSNYIDDFASVFDAAAFGIYLGGWDPYWHAASEPGVISAFCIYNPSHFTIDWKIDLEGRRVPFISYNGKQMRINNLHINNKKRLPFFYSL